MIEPDIFTSWPLVIIQVVEDYVLNSSVWHLKGRVRFQRLHVQFQNLITEQIKEMREKMMISGDFQISQHQTKLTPKIRIKSGLKKKKPRNTLFEDIRELPSSQDLKCSRSQRKGKCIEVSQVFSLLCPQIHLSFLSGLEPRASEAKQKEVEKLNRVTDTLINTGEKQSLTPTQMKQNQ